MDSIIDFFRLLFSLQSVVLGPYTITLDNVDLIWSSSKHEAFTTITYHDGIYYTAFRTGQSHKSYDGKIEIIKSTNLKDWEKDSSLFIEKEDLRDPSFIIDSNNNLRLVSVSRNKEDKKNRHKSFTWSLLGDKKWVRLKKDDYKCSWLWGATNIEEKIVSVAYLGEDSKGTIYSSENGAEWVREKMNFFPDNKLVTETAIFKTSNEYIALARVNKGKAVLGKSTKLSGDWLWYNLDKQIASPSGVVLDDKTILLALRLYDSEIRTSICSLDLESNKIKELFKLPSGGDTGYADFYRNGDEIFVIYHSSFSKNSDIYLATISLSKK